MVDTKVLTTYLTQLNRALPHATDQEKRSAAAYLLDGVTLDPDARKVEVRVKLPANALQRVEAAARIALYGTILAEHSRARLRYEARRGRRAARLVRVSGS